VISHNYHIIIINVVKCIATCAESLFKLIINNYNDSDTIGSGQGFLPTHI